MNVKRLVSSSRVSKGTEHMSTVFNSSIGTVERQPCLELSSGLHRFVTSRQVQPVYSLFIRKPQLRVEKAIKKAADHGLNSALFIPLSESRG